MINGNENKGKRKLRLLLPDNFSHVVLEWELAFANGKRSIESVRNILYLYSVSLFY